MIVQEKFHVIFLLNVKTEKEYWLGLARASWREAEGWIREFANEYVPEKRFTPTRKNVYVKGDT